ncbi:hypothetical protein CU254_41855 (plasmid) [Amycolatopsis sp. AA4]|uniref:hypothetical protein n=1 Tax=Actinomycetes TaxID=1760 RepID=UPI00056D9E64|nr:MULTISPECIES: hypothetical protein [Actinomycetes]ATY17125.1 hypothetical protein CU254_41855 [Amycolatopsis sp. AA4]
MEPTYMFCGEPGGSPERLFTTWLDAMASLGYTVPTTRRAALTAPSRVRALEGRAVAERCLRITRVGLR